MSLKPKPGTYIYSSSTRSAHFRLGLLVKMGRGVGGISHSRPGVRQGSNILVFHLKPGASDICSVIGMVKKLLASQPSQYFRLLSLEIVCPDGHRRLVDLSRQM